jgi:hypothetical protein
MDENPLAVPADRDRDWLHRGPTIRSAVARTVVVEMTAPEAIRAVVPVRRSESASRDLETASAASECLGSTALGAAIILGPVALGAAVTFGVAAVGAGIILGSTALGPGVILGSTAAGATVVCV